MNKRSYGLSGTTWATVKVLATTHFDTNLRIASGTHKRLAINGRLASLRRIQVASASAILTSDISPSKAVKVDTVEDIAQFGFSST